jgi:hypothetical protein
MSLTIAIDKGQALLLPVTLLQRSAYREGRTQQFSIGEPPDLSFYADGKQFKARPLSPWSKAELSDAVVFRAVAAVSLSDLQAISRARSLKISDNFGAATSDVSLTTSLPTEGLASGVALLLRAH